MYEAFKKGLYFTLISRYNDDKMSYLFMRSM